MRWDGVTREASEETTAHCVEFGLRVLRVYQYRYRGGYIGADYKYPYLNQKKIILSVKGVP